MPVNGSVSRAMRNAEEPGVWLPHRPVASRTPGVRLFAFPYAGAGASALHHWLAPLHDYAEVCAVQLPGREERRAEPAQRQASVLVRQLAEVIAPLMDDTPAIFFGHSMGAMLAYELAVVLEREGGAAPVHLVLSSLTPPHAPRRTPNIHRMSRDRALEALQQMGGTPTEFLSDPDLMDLMLPVVQADIELLLSARGNTGGGVVDVPITALTGTADFLAPVNEVREWRRYSASGFRLRVYDGGHFHLIDHRSDVMALLEGIVRER